jgi:hypothetical protein
MGVYGHHADWLHVTLEIFADAMEQTSLYSKRGKVTECTHELATTSTN